MSENRNETYPERAMSRHVSFFVGDDEEAIMTIDEYSAIRIPCVGEHIFFASYEPDLANDKNPVFCDFYKVIDIRTLFHENGGYREITVDYQIFLEKEKEEAK